MMENYTRYNEGVKPAIADRLLALNRRFYLEHGPDFSATRARLQPGVRRILESLRGDESILDLGCGNGELARNLARRGHRGPYLGLDFSLPLLQAADSQPEGFPARFLQADLASAGWASGLQPASFELIFAFAVLHHIPSAGLRLTLLDQIRTLLKPGGRFIHSNWQFLNSERLRARIQPWEQAAVPSGEVEQGDFLLDWKRGGAGLRYVHHFDEMELSELAAASGFRLTTSFYSDGQGGRLGLYQIWERSR
jgi:tRNA (uracil-5-)-methyltransferase TRM9